MSISSPSCSLRFCENNGEGNMQNTNNVIQIKIPFLFMTDRYRFNNAKDLPSYVNSGTLI
jgi:hypothetical protein